MNRFVSKEELPMDRALRELLLRIKPLTRLKKVSRFFDGSVKFVDESSVYMTEDTEINIGSGSIILPNVYLLGKVRIGRNCILWPNTMLLGKEREVVLEDEVQIGRPGIIDSIIGAHSRIGAHTEVVRSTLGAETAAQHWCYIGDAESGVGVNFGAGTVTANYDGEKKKKTKIGDYAFTGVNSSLVAHPPALSIGREVLVGAGAVITKDVPPNSVVVGHNRILEDTTFHKTKTGWKIRKVVRR